MNKLGIRALAAIAIAAMLALTGVTAASAATLQDGLYTEVNAQRAAAGVPPLQRDPTLDAAAQEWAQGMSNSGSFTHSSNEWRGARLAAGWTTNGENIAYGYPDVGSVMASWMGSQGHRDNILRSTFTRIGLGYVANGNYWVQVFAGYAEPVPTPPIGSLDQADVSADSTTAALNVSGWAFDVAAPATSIPVHVYVTDPSGERRGYAVTANGARPDVGAAYPSAGAAHGYGISIPVTIPGVYQVCAYAIGTPRAGGNNPIVGCRNATFGAGQPIGWVDDLSIRNQNGSPVLSVQGWALDNASRSSGTQAHVYITDPSGRTVGYALAASGERPDVAAAFGGAGPKHGFGLVQPITEAGQYRVCVYSIGASARAPSNSVLACRAVLFGPSAPIGAFDSANADSPSGTITASGWVLDDGFRGVSTTAHVYVTAPDGVTTGYAVAADGQRPDVAQVFPGAGAAHGFSVQVPAVSAGIYRVCAYSISTSLLPANNAALTCKSVPVTR